ncbi:MAG TPA: type II secretion system protein [Burkholderiales bacterium]
MVRNRGFTYLTILFAIAILAGGLALIGEVWHTSAVREKEAQLLQVGDEFRKAIERYYLSGPRIYPRNLSDLVQDPRQPGVVRHLRKIYPDPLTGSTEWGLVKAADGGIAGVHSKSEERPLKSGGFRVRDAAFEGAQQYADWKFIYAPAQQAQPGAGKPAATVPGTAPTAPAAAPPSARP